MLKAIIEMEQFSVLKTEIDKASGRLIVDRLISFAVPYAYGFVMDTMAQDDDPLDVFVVFNEGGLRPLTEVKIEVLGAFICEDNGIVDEKLVAVIKGDKDHFGATALRDIQWYLERYKPGFKVLEYVGHEKAMELVAKYSV